MRVILEFTDGPFQSRKTALQAPASLVVGRTEAAEYSVPGDPEMSSKHFRIDVDATSCGIIDLGSTNGTFVNDDRISEVELSHGDEVRAGQSRIQVSFELPKPSDTLSGSVGGTISESAPPQRTVDPPLVIPEHPATQPEVAAAPQSVDPEEFSSGIESPHAESESDMPKPPGQPSSAPVHDAGSSPHEFEPPHALLEIESEFARENKLLLSEGQTMTFGSSELADVAIPQDVGLSEVHFSLEMKSTGCVVRDRGSTTGILVDGQSSTFEEITTECQVSASETSVSIRVFGVASPTGAPSVQNNSVSESRAVGKDDNSTRSVRVERLTGAVPSTSDRPFQSGLEDPDPRVVRSALHAAVWSRESWALDYCRRAANRIETEHWETLYILAVLGTPDDVDAIVRIGQTTGFGSRRFDILGAYGHPHTVDILLEAMASDRVHDSVKASQAFSKITSIDIDSEDRIELLPEDGTEPDEFEREFLDTAFLPDIAKAKQYWSENRDRYLAATRWCRGHDVSHDAAECSEVIDLLSRWEACMRDHYHGRAVHTPTDVLKFQCRFSGESDA